MIGFYIFAIIAAVFALFAILTLLVGWSEIGAGTLVLGPCVLALSVAFYNLGCCTTPFVLHSSRLIPPEQYEMIPVPAGINLLLNKEQIFKLRGYLDVSKIKDGKYNVYYQEFKYSQNLILDDGIWGDLKIFDYDGNLIASFYNVTYHEYYK